MNNQSVPSLSVATPSIVQSSEGEALWFLGTLAIIKLDGRQTAGRYGIFEGLLPKFAAPPLHSHPQDETFIVLEGTMTVWVAGRKERCHTGALTFAPGGTPHTFFVESETARVLTLSTPAGIEEFVRDLSYRATEPRLPDDDLYPDRERIERAMHTHRMQIWGPAPESTSYVPPA